MVQKLLEVRAYLHQGGSRYTGLTECQDAFLGLSQRLYRRTWCFKACRKASMHQLLTGESNNTPGGTDRRRTTYIHRHNWGRDNRRRCCLHRRSKRRNWNRGCNNNRTRRSKKRGNRYRRRRSMYPRRRRNQHRRSKGMKRRSWQRGCDGRHHRRRIPSDRSRQNSQRELRSKGRRIGNRNGGIFPCFHR